MTSFFLISMAITTIVMALLVWGALKRQNSGRHDQARENCYRVHAQTLSELAVDHEADRISNATYEQAKFEAESRLVADMKAIAQRPVGIGKRLWLLVAILGVPVFAYGLYFLVGNLAANNPEAVFVRTGNVSQFVNAVAQLEAKVKENPDDLNSYWMLARSYRAMGRYEDSVAAFGKAWPLIKDKPTEIALFAGVLAIYRGDFAGKPDELLQQALAMDPEDQDALTLAGGSAFQKSDFVGALRYWQRLDVLLPRDSEESLWLAEQMAEARKREAGDMPESAQEGPDASGRVDKNKGTLPPGHPKEF